MRPFHHNLHVPLQRACAPSRQRGSGLLVVMISLVMIALLGIAAGVATSLNHRTARATQDRALAMSAAEAALRDAESDLRCEVWEPGTGVLKLCSSGTGKCRAICVPGSSLSQRGLTGFGAYEAGSATCPSGMCTTPVGTDLARIQGIWSQAVVYGTYTGASSLPGNLSQPPRYVIEGFKDPAGYPGYRISARGWGKFGSTSVTLQEVYRPWK